MKSIAWLALPLSLLLFAGSVQAHDRGDRIERRWDLRGDRIDRRLDRQAHHQYLMGHERLAYRLDREGDWIDTRFDRIGARREARFDRRH
jgi:hypothetical protein